MTTLLSGKCLLPALIALTVVATGAPDLRIYRSCTGYANLRPPGKGSLMSLSTSTRTRRAGCLRKLDHIIPTRLKPTIGRLA